MNEKLTFQFNRDAEFLKRNMNEQEKQRYELIEKTYQQEKARKEEGYHRHREARIEEQEKELIKIHTNRLKAPRPKGAPPPDFPSKEKVRIQAEWRVDESHRNEQEEVRRNYERSRDDLFQDVADRIRRERDPYEQILELRRQFKEHNRDDDRSR